MGIGNYSLQKLYNFIKVKSAQVVLDFNHAAAKNANSVILKTGTVAEPPVANPTSVRASYIYYYKDGEWYQADFSSAAEAGSGYLLAIALMAGHAGSRPTSGALIGTPSDVGMLLRGVTYAFVQGGATSGQPVYGSTTPGLINNAPPGGGYAQVLGWALDSDPASGDSLILFDPQYPMSGTL